ncbi:MAG: DapH/DapD/GlmU-related protein [Candidatus Jordarchaeales archaeon]
MSKGGKGPNITARIYGILVGSGLIAFPIVLAFCYAVHTVFPGLPIYVWAALTPLIYVVAKWVFNFAALGLIRASLRPVEEGYYEMDPSNPNVGNWMLNASLTSLGRYLVGFLPLGQPGLASHVLKIIGAKMGRNAIASSIIDPPLVEMGEGSVAGGGSIISGHALDGKKIYVGRVKIGKNVLIGGNTIVLPGVEIGDGAVIAAMSLIPKRTKIPPRTVWMGIPARQVGYVDDEGNIVIERKEGEGSVSGHL